MTAMKMWAAMISAFLASLVVQPLDMPKWATAICVSLVAALAVYLAPKNKV